MKTLIRTYKHYRIKFWLDSNGWWDAVIRDNRTNKWRTLKTSYRTLEAAIDEVLETFDWMEMKPYQKRFYDKHEPVSYAVKFKPVEMSKTTRFRIYRR
jgi:hypothetical protein